MSSSGVINDYSGLFAVAERYRQLGYKVTVSPPSKQLPRFLSKFRPDIVAEGPDESVVIEVKSAGKQRGAAYWKELSRVVERHPRWRVELVIDSEKSAVRQTINKELVKKRLQEAERLAEQGMSDASLLITWSAVEAAMRLAAKESEIELVDQRPASLITTLYSDGVLEREQYDFLVNLVGVRTSIAHGFDQRSLAKSVLKRLRQNSRVFVGTEYTRALSN